MLVSFGLRVFLLESAGGLGSPEQRLTVRGEKAFKATDPLAVSRTFGLKTLPNSSKTAKYLSRLNQ